MKTALAIAFSLFAAAGTAWPAHWMPVSADAERSIFLDMEALARTGNVVQAWDWQKFGERQEDAERRGGYFWVKSLTSYHCVRRTTDPVLKIYFDADGTEVGRAHLEGLRFPAAVEPDSLREKLLDLACNPPKPPAKPAVRAARGPARTAARPEAPVTPAKADRNAEPAAATIRPAAYVPRPAHPRTYTLPPRGALTAGKPSSRRKPSAAACPPPAAAAGKEAPARLTEADGEGLFN
ncbi:MAG TPA: surface-adhesin E family protein [Burkholderiales bacterium]|nr:surface-adhesin E family protein [Burkholderiales bacterium]